jgi:hypothetical protein
MTPYLPRLCTSSYQQVPPPKHVAVRPISVLHQELERFAREKEHMPSIVLTAHRPSTTAAAARRGNHVPKPKCADFSTGIRSSLRPHINSIATEPIQVNVARLNDALRKELAGNTLNTNDDFLKQLLPDERLPFPVDEDLLRKLSASIGTSAPIWNDVKSCFHQPPMDFGESAVCEWLNNIGATMGSVYSRQCERVWWTGYCGKALQVHSSILRKPVLILLDRSDYDRIIQTESPGTEWSFVKSLAEVHTPDAILTDTIAAKSYLIFLCQPHRRFTISLSFISAEKGQFSITVTDRAGQIRLNTIDLMGPSVRNGLSLLSILAFLMFGRPEDIGLDPAFKINPANGQVIAIECENRRFEVVKRIHAIRSLFGRGTQVWIVTENGIKYIMKDSWVRENRIHNEVEHLSRMKDHKELEDRVPKLICGGDVVINGIKDSTRHYRCARCTHRIHRRTVTSPVGEPIASFKSKKEFIRVMISIIDSESTSI